MHGEMRCLRKDKDLYHYLYSSAVNYERDGINSEMYCFHFLFFLSLTRYVDAGGF